MQTTGKMYWISKEDNLVLPRVTIVVFFLHRLLSTSCAVTEALGKYFKFELTVGMNGRVWVNSGSVVQVIAITNAIQKSELMTDEQCRQMVDSVAQRMW